jgi:hypothetical protein
VTIPWAVAEGHAPANRLAERIPNLNDMELDRALASSYPPRRSDVCPPCGTVRCADVDEIFRSDLRRKKEMRHINHLAIRRKIIALRSSPSPEALA